MAEDHAAYVQAELQGYLDSRDFNTIFSRLVEAVLDEKPSNAVLFMVEYLLESYPDETTEITSRFVKVNEDDEVEKDEIPETPRSPVDSEDEDEVGLDADTKLKRRRARAMAVSAEPIDPKTIKERLKLVPNVEKSPEQTNQLLEIINSSPVLSTLEPDQKATIIRALEGPVTKAEGETIITQGDPGDCFYLLQDGTVEVSVRRGRGSEESLTHTYSSGSTFGELSLLYNAPRAATCRAKSPCVLWTLDRLSFRVLVVSSTLRKRERYMSFLRQVPILETLSEMELLAVADALVPEEHRDEAIICEEGQVGEKFYLIEDGEVICTQKDPTAAATGGGGSGRPVENVITTLSKGNYFGEIALLTDKPRQATVRVAPHQTVHLLCLDRATFKRLFGPLDPILRRNLEAYNKFLARNI